MYFCSPFFEDDNLNCQLNNCQLNNCQLNNCQLNNCQLNNCQLSTDKGMYGFDSKMNCHVSMPSLAVTLVNLDCKKVIGENNYALAA